MQIYIYMNIYLYGGGFLDILGPLRLKKNHGVKDPLCSGPRFCHQPGRHESYRRKLRRQIP